VKAENTPVTASIVVLTYNQLHYTEMCLDSIIRHTDVSYELIVVDNASQDETPAYLQKFAGAHPEVRVILNQVNEGFARGNNIGAQAARGEYLVFLNNDTIVTQGWLSTLIGHVQDLKVGMVGPLTNTSGNETRIKVSYQDVKDLPAFAEDYTQEHRGQTFEIPMLPMQCVVLRRAVWDEIGPMDESFGVGMFEDDDYAVRLKRAGYQILCAEDAFIHHWGRASFGKMDTTRYWSLFRENRRKFEQKWDVRWRPPNYRNANPVQKLRAWIVHSQVDTWIWRLGALIVELFVLVMIVIHLRDISIPKIGLEVIWLAPALILGLLWLASANSGRLAMLSGSWFYWLTAGLYAASLAFNGLDSPRLAAVEIVAGSASLALLYRLTLTAGGKLAAQASAWLFYTWQVTALWTHPTASMIAMAFGLLGILLFQSALEKEGRPRSLILLWSGLAFGAAGAIQPVWVVAWAAVVLYLVLENLSWRYQAKAAAVFTAGFLGTALVLAVTLAYMGYPASGWAVPAPGVDPGFNAWVNIFVLALALPGLMFGIRSPLAGIHGFILIFLSLAFIATAVLTRQLLIIPALMPLLLPVAGWGLRRIFYKRRVSEYNSVSSKPGAVER
jgi:GT2 family glycosyltransferase